MSIASSDIKQEIFKLKQERHAVILVHNYQKGEIHEIADFAGDSLELSRLASSVPAKVIIFCGVHFMAETAYILSPDKTVILPEATAGCPMADMVTAGELQKRKAELPGYTVVTYVNSSAAVKALSDVCCTSANAVKVVKSIDNNNILFVPDRFLGQYVQSKTGNNIVFWPGHCPVHAKIRRKHIIEQKAKYPDAVVIAHPE
jgi:quinolinate synthase